MAGPACPPVHGGCIGPKNVRSTGQRAAAVAPTVPNHCLVHIPPPPNHVPVPIDSLPNICQWPDCSLLILFPPLTLGGLLISSEQGRWGVERLMYGDQTLPDGQIWDFRRRVNGAQPHFNKLGFPVINPWMKGSDQGRCVGPPPTKQPLKVTAVQ